MEPTIPTPTPEVLTPAMYGALGYVLIAFGHWAAKNGLPWLKETLGMVSARDKEIAAAAKEGPIMVLEEVKRQLAETKAQFADVLLELKDIRKQHHDCETKHAALQAEVTYLRSELEDLRNDK